MRLHASSGTTGKPTVVGYTSRHRHVGGVRGAHGLRGRRTPDDIAQITFGYTLFTGAFGLHYGLEKVGATVIPISGGNTERQLAIMQDFGTTVLVGTPSMRCIWRKWPRKKGIDTRKLSVRLRAVRRRSHTDEMRREIEKTWGILDTENYGLSEVIGPGVSGECHLKDGMTSRKTISTAEIVDSTTWSRCRTARRAAGYHVAVKEALPILRYRTKDITWLIPDKCRCGRTSMRMAKVQGRTDDMLIIRGVNVFPSQIEGVLLEHRQHQPALRDHRPQGRLYGLYRGAGRGIRRVAAG